MTAFVDTNVLIRHLTGDPPEMAARATAFLAGADELLLPDLIVAEVVYVLESYYEVPTDEVARLVRSVIAFPPIRTMDPALLLRSLEVYETHRIDFAEAYLVASAEAAGITDIISFDRSIDRVTTANRIEP
ncbi:MAG: PIN domain-containing protein [Acidimicrobiia bacterium]|nr:PIN domain-containing protein [Acidimicrobiia bacterium]